VAGGQPSVTRFDPRDGRWLHLGARVHATGRKHQIRAHAQWLGHSLVGDKMYGPDARLFLEFIETGWTDALAARLFMSRQALHCAEIDLRPAGLTQVFAAALPADMREFCVAKGVEGLR